MNDNLIPTYLEADFQTSKAKLIELMKKSETFKDYNYEGSNITTLIELISYMVDMNTYFSNKLIKNIYPDSAEVYETMHSIASIRGYMPHGYIAPRLDLTVRVMISEEHEGLPEPGDQLYIPIWYLMDSGTRTEDNINVYYVTTEDLTYDIPYDFEGDEFEFIVPMKQGRYETIRYRGSDIINNKLLLPSKNIDYDLLPYEENPSITLFVEGEPWTRVSTFSHSALEKEEDKNVFLLEYDKYKRYNIVFSSAHNMPRENDIIQCIYVNTFGSDGNIGANILSVKENVANNVLSPYITENYNFSYYQRPFINNITKGNSIRKEYMDIENQSSSYNASDPETIWQIQQNSKSLTYSQNRNITSSDYKMYLEDYPYISKGNVWGEKEETIGDTPGYNRIYISMIPSYWGDNTITYNEITWEREENNISDIIMVPNEISDFYKTNIYEHLEYRRHMNIYEIMRVPELIYFTFDIGVRVRRAYNITNVNNEILRKLKFYFNIKNRNFNEIIDFKDIHRYILDMSILDDNNKEFKQISGILDLVIRDIITFNTASEDPTMVFEPNEENYFPMYTTEEYTFTYDNVLRPIQLGFNQFPMLSVNNCTFISEK